uniref:Uncharacterized protein n=1 Tax=Pyrodinium bahamense TaxID=73915 RepID=A0A7S0FWZ8_9DINO
MSALVYLLLGGCIARTAVAARARSAGAGAGVRGGAAAGARALLQSGEAMQPEVVADLLAKVEDNWKSEAASYVYCNETTGGACSKEEQAFESSCSTIVGAVVQASSGDRAMVSEYLGDICTESVLQGWKHEHCQSFKQALVQSMSMDNYDNRQHLLVGNLCRGLWLNFLREEVVKHREEQKRQEVVRAEAAKKAAEEAKEEEQHRLEAAKKAAEEAKAEEQHRQEAARKAAEEAAQRASAEERRRAEEERRRAEEERRRAEERRLAEAREAARKAAEAKRQADEAAAMLRAKQEEAQRAAEVAKRMVHDAQVAAVTVEHMHQHQVHDDNPKPHTEDASGHAKVHTKGPTVGPSKAVHIKAHAKADTKSNSANAKTTRS